MMQRSSIILGALCLVGGLLLALVPHPAAACVIDNTASLSVDGVRAQLTMATPTDLNHYAPFTFTKAFASGHPLRIAENSTELARTLPPTERAAPYRWVFGDGAVAIGHVVTHRYAHPGLYLVEVEGVDGQPRRWLMFDKALLHVVPPGQVIQSNLGYYGLRALDIAMSALGWVFDAGLVLLILGVIISRWRTRQATSAPHGS